MKRLTSVRCNGIKMGYWSTAKKDELIQRLGRYEDTGLEPDEVHTVHAHRIEKDGNVFCSACNSDINPNEDADAFYFQYCPWCGAEFDGRNKVE